MTPNQVKEELERRGMTFAFVGQDMSAMRLMPFISMQERGQYQWKSSYKGNLEEYFNKNKSKKRTKEPLQFGDQKGSGELQAPRKPLKLSSLGSTAMADEHCFRQRDVTFHDDLELLLAIAEQRDDQKEIVEVCGYRIL